jgi:hypothetical protein
MVAATSLPKAMAHPLGDALGDGPIADPDGWEATARGLNCALPPE